MSIVKSYSDINSDIRTIQKFRLYYLDRPAIKYWRATRHGRAYPLDYVDRWIISKYNKITAIDFGGWYLNNFGVDTVCVESSNLSKMYHPNCYVEFDLLEHKPTYIPQDRIVVFKNPWFFKYLELDNFIKFLKVWEDTQLVLNFNPIYIQHNHLKYKLENLISAKISANINVINKNLWTINIQ